MNEGREEGVETRAHSQEQADYFMNIARFHGVNNEDNVDKFDVIRELLCSASTHPRVIECGAGGGYYTRHLLALGYHVTAIDLSAEALKVNRSWADENGYGQRLVTYAGDFTDIVTSNALHGHQFFFFKVLHHFQDLAQIRSALSTAITHAEAGGRIAIFEPNGQNPLWKVLYLLTRDRVTGRPKWHYEKNLRLIRRDNLESIIPSGVIVNFRYHYLIPAFILKKVPALNSLNSAAERLLSKSRIIDYSSNISCVIDVR